MCCHRPAARGLGDEDAGPRYASELYRSVLDESEMHPRLRYRPVRGLAGIGPWAWEDDPELELEYHLRHSALPDPGRIRELLALASRLHGTLLDRSRPMWESHIIEGLADGRFATYTKVHHSLMDGVSAMAILQRGLSPDPDERGMPAPFAARRESTCRRPREDPNLLQTARHTVGMGIEGLRGALGASQIAVSSLLKSLSDQAAAIPSKAPPSLLNVTISSSRRFAADSWSIARLKAVSTALGGTINDVVLAVCAGSLRRYLDDLDGLPDDPLVAMVPVSLPRATTSRPGTRSGSSSPTSAPTWPIPSSGSRSSTARPTRGSCSSRA